MAIVGGSGIIYINQDPATEGLVPTEASPTPAEWAWDNTAKKLWYWDRVGDVWIEWGSGHLEQVTENSNTGYRIRGRNPANHGNTGAEAVDLSFSPGASSTNGATGAQAMVWNLNARADGATATAWGSGSRAQGERGTAWGQVSRAGTSAAHLNPTAWGRYTSTSANQATAWGSYNTASGVDSTSWGYFNTSSGLRSTSWGAFCIASAIDSTAWGGNTDATNLFATAFGRRTVASGYLATAWGSYSTASAERATAWGGAANSIGATTNFATGYSSTCFGVGNTANSFNSLVFGTFSVTATGQNVGLFVSTDEIMRIGNGTADNSRSNALVLYKNAVLKQGGITAAAASALTPTGGEIAYVTTTNGTFTQVGFWGFQNSTWTKL